MKKKNIIFAIVIVACALIGLLFFIILNNKKVGISYDSFIKCKESVDNIGKKSYSNLDFSNCSISSVKDMMADKAYSFTTELKTSVEDNKDILEEKRKKIVSLYFELYGKDVSKLDYSTESIGFTCSSEEVYYTIGINDTFAMFDVERFVLPITALMNRKEVYRFDKLKDTSGIKGKKINLTLDDSISMCNEWANDKLKEFSIGDSFKLHTAYLIEGMDGKQYYIIRYQHAYKGIPLNDIGNAATSDYGYMKYNWLEFEVDSKGIAGVRSFYATSFISEAEIEDSFVTFDSACELLSDFLAPYGKYEVESVSIEYSAPAYTDEADTQKEFVYHPMWVYLVKSGEADSADIDPRMSMYVDMVDGTIFVIDAINNEPWFSVNPNLNLK